MKHGDVSAADVSAAEGFESGLPSSMSEYSFFDAMQTHINDKTASESCQRILQRHAKTFALSALSALSVIALKHPLSHMCICNQ